MKFRHKPLEVDAIQWMQFGDCPEAENNYTYEILEPGMFIILYPEGGYKIMSKEHFQDLYEAVTVPHLYRYESE